MGIFVGFIMAQLAVVLLGMPTDINDKIDICINEAIETCGDVICEGDSDFDSVIYGTGDFIKNCLSEKF